MRSRVDLKATLGAPEGRWTEDKVLLTGKVRQAFAEERLEGRVGEERRASLDPIVEIGVAPEMQDFVDAPGDAAEIADAIAEMAELDLEPFRRIDLEKMIKRVGMRAVVAHLDEVVGVGEILNRHERRRREQALEFRGNQFRLRGAKGLPGRMSCELGAPLSQSATSACRHIWMTRCCVPISTK